MKKIILTTVILVVLAAAGFGVAVLLEKNKDEGTAEPATKIPVVTQDPFLGQPSEAPTPSEGEPVSEMPVSEPAPEASAPSLVPPQETVPSSPVVGDKVFVSRTGLKVTMSNLWQAQETIEGSENPIAFYDSALQLVSLIQVFTGANDTLELIERQLATSPSVTNIQKVTAAGLPALHYITPRGPMLGFVHKGSTYYISGQLVGERSRLTF